MVDSVETYLHTTFSCPSNLYEDDENFSNCTGNIFYMPAAQPTVKAMMAKYFNY